MGGKGERSRQASEERGTVLLRLCWVEMEEPEGKSTLEVEPRRQIVGCLKDHIF